MKKRIFPGKIASRELPMTRLDRHVWGPIGICWYPEGTWGGRGGAGHSLQVFGPDAWCGQSKRIGFNKINDKHNRVLYIARRQRTGLW